MIVKELLDFAWDREFTIEEVVSSEQAHKYYTDGTAAEGNCRMEFDEPGWVRMEWQRTFREECAYFLRKVIPVMQKRSDNSRMSGLYFGLTVEIYSGSIGKW